MSQSERAKMNTIFYVQNKYTREILNLKGGWSDSIKSYRVATFNSEVDAQAAFPPGVECVLIKVTKKGDK